MSLIKKYSKEVRNNLSYIPVWQPGDRVKPGDIGKIENGAFVRQGKLTDIFSDLSFSVRSNPQAREVKFHSSQCSMVQIGGAVPSGTVGSAGAGVNVDLKVNFGMEGAVLFHALEVKTIGIDNLLDIRNYISDHHAEWPEGHLFVSHVEEAAHFVVLISAADDASVHLKGTANIPGFDVANMSVSILDSKNLGYQFIGGGPLMLRLYRLGWWSGVPQPLGMPGQMTDTGPEEDTIVPYELSAHDPSFDE